MPPPPISRRRFLHMLTAASGTLILAACRNRLPLPATVTPVAPPVGTPPLVGFVSPTPGATPNPLATPSGGARVFLPLVNGQAPSATPSPTGTPAPTATPTPEPCLTPGAPPPDGERPMVGLHASADPQITPLERCTFVDLRPSLIKVLSFHPPEDIARLAGAQPWAHWLVRTFLEFGGRAITADQFVEFTFSDTQRSVGVLANRPIVVELHNEPNLVAEGWGASWRNGREFGAWWLDVLGQYRATMPNVPYIYPGLSPGPTVRGIRTDHFTFLEQSRAAVEAADGLGVHLYWSADFPMQTAFATLDETIRRFPNKPIWITEASYNQGGIDDRERARQYLAFIDGLSRRPAVQGVTFFVASAIDDTFAPETWVGKEIGALVGERD